MCASDLYDTWSESTTMKDKETERDKIVIKPRASETISRPSSMERRDVTMEGDRARRQDEEMQRWVDREIKGLPVWQKMEQWKKRALKADKQIRVASVHDMESFQVHDVH